ncbi:MAG: GTPase ObgE [Vulcanimicrobiaceae bacterium]
MDEATITVAAGTGGDGLVAWRREKYVPKGGPAGGDGGKGGDVILEADPGISTLVDFRYKKQFAAESGRPGGTSNKSGRAGDDLHVRVPVGTIVYKNEGEAPSTRMRRIADLAHPGERLVVARGGKGGLGNQHFATATRQAPRFAEHGESGETAELRLELKLLADCGIVGLPNAGKSTLLSVVSAARPKIADYPFTTLEPQLGVVRIDEFNSFVLVDVPGLIEGAHAGAGLGDRFLRHVERTRVLVHLIDGAKTVEEIFASKATIEDELRAWSPQLLEKPTIVCISKLDIPEARDNLEALRSQIPGLRGISAATGEGVQELIYATWNEIRRAPGPEVLAPEPPRIVLQPKGAFAVDVRDGVYVVSGERVERLAEMTDFDNDEALGRFERVLAKLGVEKRLRDMGIREGDTVRIGDTEFTYS